MKLFLPQLLVVVLLPTAISFSLRVAGSSSGDNFLVECQPAITHRHLRLFRDDLYAELLKP